MSDHTTMSHSNDADDLNANKLDDPSTSKRTERAERRAESKEQPTVTNLMRMMTLQLQLLESQRAADKEDRIGQMMLFDKSMEATSLFAIPRKFRLDIADKSIDVIWLL